MSHQTFILDPGRNGADGKLAAVTSGKEKHLR